MSALARRLERTAPPVLEHLVAVPTGRAPASTADIEGVDLDGSPLHVHLVGAGAATLVLFLSVDCDGCRPFWSGAGDPVAAGLVDDEPVVVVARDGEDPAEMRRLLGPGPISTPVVRSGAAWSAYRVQGPPFFVVAGGDRVLTEGVAWAVGQVAADVRRARRRP